VVPYPGTAPYRVVLNPETGLGSICCCFNLDLIAQVTIFLGFFGTYIGIII
jgi:hypothetical protein